MPQGLQVFNADGSVRFDINTRTGTILGIVSTGISDGYVEHSAFAMGTPTWILQSVGATTTVAQPKMSVSWTGSIWRLSWTWDISGNPGNTSCQLIYGVH